MTLPKEPAVLPDARINLTYTTDVLLRLLNTPSPTGFTEDAVRLIEEELSALGVSGERTRKGALRWTLPSREGAAQVTFSAHVDTLGAMVKDIKPSGRLTLTQLGGYDWATVEGEYARVHLQGGRTIGGTVVNIKQSTHVFGAELRELKRDDKTLELRLDEVTRSAEETRALGVQVGDFVSWEARAVLTESGYLKSRHIDNKAAVAIFLAVTKAVLERQVSLAHTVHFFISNYEEVGHGASTGIPAQTSELIAVDMAAIGPGQNSDEHCVTLCVKDSSGPYDHALGNRLRQAARRAKLDLRTDIYPYYGSDASAAWRAGGDYPAALIGPGVDASHAYERTHLDALSATGCLILTYVAG
ncbi:M42 family metallopeptidase [Deinococcus peraridilitoris]|uniref:Peptidase family protein n=1 Tax=Deinococcus peraridilitoris (strain DSM 19664 / LMG 22246 / CIP 109416 / KR-200) TaxID=937777 RepID=L0A0W2_DEIPD|nr:M42 family metallopeptidase [Deinococcus peraridilitoris]AFZ66822.1 peptidase family protein [Deinococcus peraridilitoris DSM 19664]